jgi:hypothetical protein
MKDRMLIERFIIWYYKPLRCKLGFHRYHIIEELGRGGVKVKCSRCDGEEYGYRATHDGIACKDGTYIVVVDLYSFWDAFWERNNFDEDSR